MSINIPANTTTAETRKSASDYAKAKVEQIRKKFGYSQNKQNSQPMPKHQTSTSSVSKATPKNITSTTTNAVNMSVTNVTSVMSVTGSARKSSNVGIGGGELHQFENRIKNIDNINKKIQEILNFKLKEPHGKMGNGCGAETFRDSGNMNVNVSERGKRASVSQFDRRPLKEYQLKMNLDNLVDERLGLVDRKIDANSNSSTHVDARLKQRERQKQKEKEKQKEKQREREKERQKKKLSLEEISADNRREHTGLRVPNSKYTVSIQLQCSPKKQEKEKQKEKERQKQRQRYFKRQTIAQIKETKPVQIKKIALPTPKTNTNAPKIHEQQFQKKETQKLAQTLSEQILLDQKLRFSKWQFSEWTNPQKLQLLSQKFPSQSLSPSQLQTLFTLSPQQHNPFFQQTQPITETCLAQLIKNYNEATKYWSEQVRECVSIGRLEKQQFSVRDIDLNRKGFLSIQDLVCFVNLYTGKFFRNRDAIGLMKRFVEEGRKQGEGISYECFLDKITRS